MIRFHHRSVLLLESYQAASTLHPSAFLTLTADDQVPSPECAAPCQSSGRALSMVGGRVGYRTPGCVQVLVSGAEDLARTTCSTFP